MIKLADEVDQVVFETCGNTVIRDTAALTS